MHYSTIILLVGLALSAIGGGLRIKAAIDMYAAQELADESTTPPGFKILCVDGGFAWRMSDLASGVVTTSLDWDDEKDTVKPYETVAAARADAWAFRRELDSGKKQNRAQLDRDSILSTARECQP